MMRARVVDSSDDAVRVSARAALLLVGGNIGGVINVGRSEDGEDGSEGVHFRSRFCDVERCVNGV
jgi:hypothetical protein